MQTLPPPADQLVGKTLGQYDIEQLLGYGNLNAVYAARQQPQKRAVMLTTFLMPETFSDEARDRFTTRFAQQASLLVRLNHPHILPIADFGEQVGYPYLVTPFVVGASLANVLNQEQRCTPERVLPLLKQIAEGLDYIHSNGVVHGTLKPANILLNDEQGVQITGFGLTRMLGMQGIEQIEHPYIHLMSSAGTFLGAAEYTAPEVVQGAPADERSDIYALGILLFQLLTGALPFSGDDPFVVAMQHVEENVPSLQSVWPDALPALDLIVQRAVERDPAHRFQSAGKLVNAYERVLSVVQQGAIPAVEIKPVPSLDKTLPPPVSWFEGAITVVENWHAEPPAPRGHFPRLGSTGATPKLAQGTTGGWQLRPPIITGRMPSIEPPVVQQAPLQNYAQVPTTPEPIAEKQDADALVLEPNGPTATARPDEPPALVRSKGADQPIILKESKKRQERPTLKSRRRAVAVLAAGVVAAGVVGGGGIGLAHILRGGHLFTADAQPAAQQSPVQSTTGNGQKAPAATKTSKAKAHPGTVIGKTSQGVNSATAFSNPADGNGSLLVRLPNGSFVAYESACTHQGVTVRYHPETQTFICPLHGSVFDPKQKGKVLHGPATLPLPAVQVHVNGDGTITTG
ncbi:MAG: protein kinase [Chloroflexota bacterium]|nr:protein kinase [Chloroflexota bacterium]